MKKIKNSFIQSMTLILTFTLVIQIAYTQQVEVQGALKVTQMTANDTQDDLVVRNTDGTLGTRSVASLPAPLPPIDTTRNLASDFELAKHLCDCPNLPPFMIMKLLDSGYTQEELVASGVSVTDVIDAQRGGVLIDSRDNQSYKTVTIGGQTWMAENLNFGTMIDGSDNQLDNSIIEKYCYDDIANNCNTYGGLYQWNEAMQYVTIQSTQGVCPTGWHLPSDDEWQTLEIELGLNPSQASLTGLRGTDQGSQMSHNKPFWTDGELDQNGAFGSSGFGAMPGGLRNTGGGFAGKFTDAYFHSTQPFNAAGFQLNYGRHINNTSPKIDNNLLNQLTAESVRCVMD